MKKLQTAKKVTYRVKTVNVHVEKIESAVQTVDYVPERKTTRANKGI